MLEAVHKYRSVMPMLSGIHPCFASLVALLPAYCLRCVFIEYAIQIESSSTSQYQLPAYCFPTIELTILTSLYLRSAQSCIINYG